MLDMLTIIVATYCTAIVQGLLLLFFWNRDGRPPALGLSGLAFMAFGGGFALLGSRALFGVDVASGVGGALVATSGVLFIAAARRLRHGATPPLVLALPAAIWIAAYFLASFMTDSTVRTTILSVFMAGCFFICAIETLFWKVDGHAPRHTFLVVAVIFCMLFAVRAAFNAELPFPLGSQRGGESVWFGAASLLIFVLLSMVAFLSVGMAQGRSDAGRDTQAVIDPLTGALRRGAFFLQGARMVARHHEDGRSACLALVRLASPTGVVNDEALRIFARAAAGALKPTDLIARMNGADFAILLSDAAIGEGSDLANTLARRFAEASAAAGYPTLMRAGLVSSTQENADLRAMVVAAEQSLRNARYSGEPVVHWHPSRKMPRVAAGRD